MKICFVLPRFSRRAIGGYKIVYEYANRLEKKGHEISIFYLNDITFVEHKIPNFIRPIASTIMTKIEPRWFELDKKILKLSGTRDKDIETAKNTDICVATGVETVEPCLSMFEGKKKIYLIQGFENWVANEDYVYSTYDMGLVNVVISDWLKQIVDAHSDNKAILIRNPIDLELYKPIKPIEKRKLHSIGLLYHSGEHKGLKYSFAALKKLKEKYEDLDVYMFGTSEPSEEIPGIKKYIKDASSVETVDIYNSISVFMCSSINEGYGLTGMEAMACGAVLVSTDYPAVHEYAVHKENALLSPVYDVDAMVKNVEVLFENPKMLYKLSDRGVESLKAFNWDDAVNAFMVAIGCNI